MIEYSFPNSFHNLTSILDNPSKEASECYVPWNDETDLIYSRCLNNYKKIGLESLVYHISEFVKSIFGVSDWQNARNRLAGYLACVHCQSEPGASRSMSTIMIYASLGYYHFLAENILRYKTNYDPITFNRENLNDNPYFIDSIVLNLKGRKQWNELPPESSDEYGASKNFKRLFGCQPKDYT